MSTPKNRTAYIQAINEQVRENGNTNVLLVHAIAQHLGLSAAEFECCSLIRDHGPFTAGELARRCRISTGGMTGMIDRLERRGLVRRETDPQDRRRVLVSVVRNDDAVYKIRALYDPTQRAFDDILQSYDDDQLAFIHTFMSRINAMFSESISTLPDSAALTAYDTPEYRKALAERNEPYAKNRSKQ